jgi:5-methylcytosine-specific restriction endonuclease McrA
MTISVPRVVALKDYAPVSSEPKFCRRSILLRDHFECQYCGKGFLPEDLTFDHMIPRAKGGKTEWENILTCCVPCNAKKRDSMPNLSGGKGKGVMRPLKMPRRPSSTELLRSGLAHLDPAIKDDFGSWLYWSTPLDP